VRDWRALRILRGLEFIVLLGIRLCVWKRGKAWKAFGWRLGSPRFCPLKITKPPLQKKQNHWGVTYIGTQVHSTVYEKGKRSITVDSIEQLLQTSACASEISDVNSLPVTGIPHLSCTLLHATPAPSTAQPPRLKSQTDRGSYNEGYAVARDM
jgi:hypothetical protein